MEEIKRYTVKYERDSDGWWVASATGLKGCHTQGRSIDEARRHIREAIAACFDLSARDEAALQIHDDIKVPAATKRLLAKLATARAKDRRGTARRSASAARRTGSPAARTPSTFRQATSSARI